MSCNEIPIACREHFSRIDARLRESELSVKGQGKDIGELSVMTARLNEKITSLSTSLRALTRALWGVTGSAVAVLLGFVLWYIQSL